MRATNFMPSAPPVFDLEWASASGTHELLGEAATWSVAEQALYWIAIRDKALLRLDWKTGAVRRYALDQLVGGIVLEQSGTVLLALREAIWRLDPRTGDCAHVLTLESGLPENRLNEFKCDPLGRLWCGSMWDFGEQVRGKLYVVDAAWSVTTVRSEVCIPNSLAFSIVMDRVYFADTDTGAIEYARLSTDVAAHPLSWTTYSPAGAVPGRPDGAALDAEGYLWTARPRGGCVARIAPDGTVDRILPLPVSHATSCAFGGPDLDTLFVTTMRQRLTPAEIAAQPLAGHLLCAKPGVCGVPDSLFRAAGPLTAPIPAR